MVDSIDDRLALVILKDYCRGLKIEEVPLQVALDVRSVDYGTLSAWDAEAGGKINRRTLNDFLGEMRYGQKWAAHDVSRCIQYDDDVLVGERIVVRSEQGETMQLMKMYSGEYLDLDSPRQNICALPMSDNSLSIKALVPCRTFQLLDRMWISDLASHDVTYNLWPLFNDLRNCMESGSFNGLWMQLLHKFSKAGLGTFVFCTLADTILKYQQ